MVGRAFVAEAVSPADTGGGHRFSAQGTSDDGRVAWRSVSRLKQRWQSPGLIDLLHSHRPIDQPSTCLAMCSCPDRSLRSECRLYWFVGSVLVAASTSSKSARGPSAWAELMITVGNWRLGHRSRTDSPRAHGGLTRAMIGVWRRGLVVARARREINVTGFVFRSSVSWLLPQSQLTAGHHRSRRDGLTATEAQEKRIP
jgi:hypothetical protein